MIQYALRTKNEHISAYSALRTDALFLYHDICGVALKEYKWFDIMRLAAYKQYNKALPVYADYCGTGRLKRNYGVEPIMRLLSGSRYYEKHNALCDAIDELKIIDLLGYGLDGYAHAQINAKKEKITCNKRKNINKYKNNPEYSDTSEASQNKIKHAVAANKIDVLKYSIGDYVIHIDYGKGIITEVRLITDDLYLIGVTFKLYGEMVFQMPYNEKYFSEANK